MEILKVSRIQAKEMFALEAKENGYRVNNCSSHTPGFEVTYEEGYKSWCPCSIIAHNSIPSSDKYFIPERESNMPEYLNRLHDEFDDLKNKFNNDLYDGCIYPPIENTPKKYSILKRNYWIIDNCDYLIFYVIHSFGGAVKALEYAKRKKVKFINLTKI